MDRLLRASPIVVFGLGILCGIAITVGFNPPAVMMVILMLFGYVVDRWRQKHAPLDPKTTWLLAALALAVAWSLLYVPRPGAGDPIGVSDPMSQTIIRFTGNLSLAFGIYFVSSLVVGLFVRWVREDRADPTPPTSVPRYRQHQGVNPSVARFVFGGFILTSLLAGLLGHGPLGFFVTIVVFLATASVILIPSYLLVRLVSGAWREKGWLPNLTGLPKIWASKWANIRMSPTTLVMTAVLWALALMAVFIHLMLPT